MKREGVIALAGKTKDDDDAGFSRIIAILLLEKFATEKEIARGLGAPPKSIRRWATGEQPLHPAMKRIVLAWIREWKYLCMCPKECDCQNPPPMEWPNKDVVYHVSMMCPEHNENPAVHEDCPVHNKKEKNQAA